VTKLAHVHFVSNQQARKRLIQMGEADDTIFVIGSPDIDIMLSDHLPSLESVRERYQIPFERYAIVMYHPVTTELPLLRKHVDQLVSGLELAALNYVIVYPNNDTGSEIILEGLNRLQGRPSVRLIPSMRFEYFLTLLKHARAIVGNSSAGVREAPVYGIPTVNIGTRQMNRFHHSSILNVPEDATAVADALAHLPDIDVVEPSQHFGTGQSARRFMEALRRPRFWTAPRQKQFRDLQFADEIDHAALRS
jgi:UDP-N-acetylglucosamine 2-epimerase (hydrolysing)